MNTLLSPATAQRPARLPGPNEPCWCGSGTKYKKCHRDTDSVATKPRTKVKPGVVGPRREVPAAIERPDYVVTGNPGPGKLGDPATRLERMRKSCRAVAEVLEELGKAVQPGVTTDALDGLCHEAYIKRGGYPSTLGYRGFPKSMCTSVNEIIVHGIPDSRPLERGDIVNLDVTIYLNGMHGDCSATFGVGEIDDAAKRLMRVTQECLMLGIEAVKPGQPIHVIGRAIQTYAEKQGYGVVRQYCGHGIGEIFHTDLQIPHYFDPSSDQILEEGMFFTVEPMLTEGTWRHVDWDDGWTVVTADGKRSAQYEHTVLVKADGAEILTRTR
ncbi:MAG: type I methionyl aminopeptidase [Myxococcaceae bacterium]